MNIYVRCSSIADVLRGVLSFGFFLTNRDDLFRKTTTAVDGRDIARI